MDKMSNGTLFNYFRKNLKRSYSPFYALKKSLSAGYTLGDFRSDFIAGLIVALVAIPLNMSLAIATGVPPQFGLYTAIIAGIIVALFGGSRFQVTGPTAAFVVILAPIVQQFGLAGLATAGLLAGIIILIMGLTRTGQIIQYIPYPVTVGFTSGIALVIFSIQLKDFFGFSFSHVPESFFHRFGLYFSNIHTFQTNEFVIAAISLIGLFSWHKINKKLPAPIVIIPLMTVVGYFFNQFFPEHQIATIASRFITKAGGVEIHGIPAEIFSFQLPWDLIGPINKTFSLNYETLKALLLPSIAIALLGTIESLLSAVVADGMGKSKHNPNSELVALGLGNIIAPFFGGIPATGAIARTSTNIKFGAKTPIASILHAIFILLILLTLAPAISLMPMATLAALLINVAYNMCEWRRFVHIVKTCPKSDISVLLICFGLTVVFDMVIGVTFGVVLAALLFMRRTIELSSGAVYDNQKRHPHHKDVEIPDNVLVYEIVGPMFFGVAEKVISSFKYDMEKFDTAIFVLDKVPSIDATALSAFSATIERMQANNKKVYLTGVQPHPLHALRKANLLEGVTIKDSIYHVFK